MFGLVPLVTLMMLIQAIVFFYKDVNEIFVFFNKESVASFIHANRIDFLLNQ